MTKEKGVKQMEENVNFVISNSKRNDLSIIGLPKGKGKGMEMNS